MRKLLRFLGATSPGSSRSRKRGQRRQLRHHGDRGDVRKQVELRRLWTPPIYIACVATFVAGSVLAIVAPTFVVFLVARAIQAVGAGGIFPVAAAAIADRVPRERRGSALGPLGAVWGLAAIVGPTFGGVVTHFVSWRWIFAANVPLGLIVIVRSRSHVPAAAARTRGPLDVGGLVLLAFGLLAIMIRWLHSPSRSSLSRL